MRFGEIEVQTKLTIMSTLLFICFDRFSDFFGRVSTNSFILCALLSPAEYTVALSPCRGHDTVGAVAVDCSGNVACATSTGGIRNKMVGRVGDHR